MLLAVVGFAGVIGYAMTRPDSPHSLERYLKEFDVQQNAPAALGKDGKQGVE
jgi:hypothetical protein